MFWPKKLLEVSLGLKACRKYASSLSLGVLGFLVENWLYLALGGKVLNSTSTLVHPGTFLGQG